MSGHKAVAQVWNVPCCGRIARLCSFHRDEKDLKRFQTSQTCRNADGAYVPVGVPRECEINDYAYALLEKSEVRGVWESDRVYSSALR